MYGVVRLHGEAIGRGGIPYLAGADAFWTSHLSGSLAIAVGAVASSLAVRAGNLLELLLWLLVGGRRPLESLHVHVHALLADALADVAVAKAAATCALDCVLPRAFAGGALPLPFLLNARRIGQRGPYALHIEILPLGDDDADGNQILDVLANILVWDGIAHLEEGHKILWVGV